MNYSCECCGKPIDSMQYKFSGVCSFCDTGACQTKWPVLEDLIANGHWPFRMSKPENPKVLKLTVREYIEVIHSERGVS